MNAWITEKLNLFPLFSTIVALLSSPENMVSEGLEVERLLKIG